MITMKDANGNYVVLDEGDVIESLAVNNLTLYGMDLAALIELRSMYMAFGGKEPVTKGSIRQLFAGRVLS